MLYSTLILPLVVNFVWYMYVYGCNVFLVIFGRQNTTQSMAVINWVSIFPRYHVTDIMLLVWL